MSALSFHPLAELFPLIEGREFDDLVADIKANGLREAVVLDRAIAEGGRIVDGRNRYRACEAANIAPRFDVLAEGIDLRAFVISKNLHRRHLNESQRAMVAARLADMPAHRPDDKSANLRTSQAEAASLVNVSPRSVTAAKAVQDRGAPELVRAVEQGHLPVSAAAQAARLAPEQQRRVAEEASAGRANVARTVLKQETRETREKDLAAKLAALPDKRYGVILADPEWRFEPFSRETGMDRAADNHYPTSDVDVIASRPVKKIAADDCVLFLWATVPMLPQALNVMAAWGFDYRSHAIWEKDRQGTGYWFRNVHELLLVGTRGDVPAPAPGTQFTSILKADVGEHSVKPDGAYVMIETYFPNLPKIELNARRTRPGWDAWGLEAPAAGSQEASAPLPAHDPEAGELTENESARDEALAPANQGGNHVTRVHPTRTSGKAGTGEGSAVPVDPVPAMPVPERGPDIPARAVAGLADRPGDSPVRRSGHETQDVVSVPEAGDRIGKPVSGSPSNVIAHPAEIRFGDEDDPHPLEIPEFLRR